MGDVRFGGIVANFGSGGLGIRCFAGRGWVGLLWSPATVVLLLPFRRICLNHLELGLCFG
uniref:Uncharacterized protein n=1 Tax=Arundo donax TaxID=35708 RepID=A0A0A9H6V6_ARUDO